MIPLLFLAVAIGGIGLLFLSQATAGVGLIAFACLLGICARIAQAADHRRAALPVVQAPVETRSPEVLQGIQKNQDRILYALGGGFLLVAVIIVLLTQIGPDVLVGLFAG